MNTRQKHTSIALTAIAASLLYIPLSAWAGCTINSNTNVVADAGSTCTVASGPYVSSNMDATLLAESAGVLTLDNSINIDSTNAYGLYARGDNSKISSTGRVEVYTNSDDDNAIYANDRGSINLNNVDIQTNGATYAQGLIAENLSNITVTGTTKIVTRGNSSSELWKGNEGIVAISGSTINLNDLIIDTSGNYSSGIVSGFGLSAVTASGQANIATRGQYADAILTVGQGNVTLTNTNIKTFGANSAIIRSANDAKFAPNQIVLGNGNINAQQANTIEINSGASNITFHNIISSASDGYLFMNVDGGTNLAATGFHDAGKLAPTPSNLNFTANKATISGDSVVAADGSTANLNFNDQSIYSGKMSNVTNATMNNSVWNVTDDSSISQNLNNAGNINFQSIGTTITVGGNYTGTVGSVIRLNTQLGDDNSPTDKLHVVGDTTGTTRLDVVNVGGSGAQTVDGINVVQVDGNSAADSFTMAAPVQAGSYEYTLKQGSSKDTNDWYLTSKYLNTTPITPVDPTNPTNPTSPINIYRPGIAAYITAHTTNADAAMNQMSTLHQRMGEQRYAPTNSPQTWGRVIASGQSNNGHDRFEYDQTTAGFQFGRDLLSKTSNTGKKQRAGVTFNYAHSNIDARDRVRSLVGLEQNTGSIRSNTIGLGGYYTQIAQNGSYFDAVAQINHLTNKYNDSYGGKSTQHGWQFGLSGEVGKPVANIKGWSVEPQAQLSYLYTRYNDFSDKYSNIAGENTHNLRGRLGLRLAKDTAVEGQSAQYYAIANVVHDFIKPKSVSLSDVTGTGSSHVTENFDRTYGEIGAGIQGSVSKSTDIYADARYQRSFKGEKEGAQFNVGVKVSF